MRLSNPRHLIVRYPYPARWASRKARRGKSLDLSDLVALETETEGSAASRCPPLLGAVEQQASASSSPYPVIGDHRSQIFHRPDYTYYSEVEPYNRVAFNSEAEGEVAGYRMTGNCPSGGCYEIRS